jgi:twitching motility two-component system response regulator PilH
MSNRKILIVGDSIDEAAHLLALVVDAGFVPICAASADAVERARAEIPDLILVNVVAPPTDGYETCRDLRADVAIRHIPLIVMSARSHQSDQLWARLQGASNLVGQPCSGEQLLGAIRTALV